MSRRECITSPSPAAHPEWPVSLPDHEQVGLPPAILKHAGGMFHLFIIEGRRSRNGPSIRALDFARSLLRMTGKGKLGEPYASSPATIRRSGPGIPIQ